MISMEDSAEQRFRTYSLLVRILGIYSVFFSNLF